MELKEAYLRQMRSFFSDVIWTHKIQCSQMDIYETKLGRYNNIKGVLQSLSASGVLIAAISDIKILSIFSALVLFGTYLLDNILKVTQYKDKIGKIKVDTTNLVILRNRLKFDILTFDNYNNEILKEKIDSYENQTRSIYLSLYNPSSKAVKIAEEKLKMRKDDSKNKEFIDSCLLEE